MDLMDKHIRIQRIFFYYAQIRSKQEDSTQARKLDGLVPIENIAEMMRALGYYPTNKEIDNMKEEIKYSKYLDTQQYVLDLNLEIFLRLFVNHRPVYGITKGKIMEALDCLKERIEKDKPNSEKKDLTREQFLEILQKEGEKMQLPEIKDYVNTLIQEGNLEDLLPDVISNDFVIDQLLGFEDADETSKQKMTEEQPDLDLSLIHI
eukprot:TRINITY_DN6162_c0_g1_i5.p4 TRINITY_DN6162_c0_g1~~TRINITY_DN6162_c0_g1_i5.p4  ORF type:complete len:206 (+),score=48.65 TRINITY_DN6162_c0_g1_i5:1555-2172(+)